MFINPGDAVKVYDSCKLERRGSFDGAVSMQSYFTYGNIGAP
jgi:hypothetical protein